MQELLFALIFGYLVAWLLVRSIRELTRPAPNDALIKKLERAHRHACEIGDIAGADQLEAHLRDIPGSGWGRPASPPGAAGHRSEETS